MERKHLWICWIQPKITILFTSKAHQLPLQSPISMKATASCPVLPWLSLHWILLKKHLNLVPAVASPHEDTFITISNPMRATAFILCCAGISPGLMESVHQVSCFCGQDLLFIAVPSKIYFNEWLIAAENHFWPVQRRLNQLSFAESIPEIS